MKRRLMVIILSLTLIFTLIPMTAFADDGTVTITLKASTIDNGVSASYVLKIPKGKSLSEYFSNGAHSDELNEIKGTFNVNGYYYYNPSMRAITTIPNTIGKYETNDDILETSSATEFEKWDASRTLYVPLFKILKTIKLKLEAPVCGDEVKEVDNFSRSLIPKATPTSSWFVISESDTPEWLTGTETKPNTFLGTFEGEKSYLYYLPVESTVGYTFDKDTRVEIPGAKVTETFFSGYAGDFSMYGDLFGRIDAVHNWNSGKVTKKPTAEATGVKIYTCKGCGKTKTESIPKLGSDPTQMGSDGTAVGEGASAAAADQKITGMKTDTDPKGSKFNKLALRSTKQTKTSITLKWKSNKKAEKYVIYGNRCGSSTKIRKSVKLYTVKKSTKTTMTKVIKKVKGAAVKKNTYYKFLVVALNKNNKVVSTSRMIHVATKGGKYTNYKSISVDKEKITKAKNLKKGKSLKLEPKQVKVTKSLKARKHVAIRYESSNKTIAKVTSKGVIKALKKGTCYVYIYAQNGVYKRIKVVVK